MSDIVTPIVLGIVEGVTEYLPVSSTGHLILATELMGFDAEKWALFNVAIQPGAILAILVLYWRTFWAVLLGLVKAERGAIAFVVNLLLAFIPAVVIGLAFNDAIEALLENAAVVAWALIIGGVAILIVERFAKAETCGRHRGCRREEFAAHRPGAVHRHDPRRQPLRRDDIGGRWHLVWSGARRRSSASFLPCRRSRAPPRSSSTSMARR
jgi:undecaprenyl pyrophosphate phosphatase UppP